MASVKKIAIITGSERSIGKAIIQAYRSVGFAVIASSPNPGQSSDPDIVAVPGDIADRSVAEHVVNRALSQFGRIDALVNNAGACVGKSFTDYTTQDFHSAVHGILSSFFHVTQLTIPGMINRGSGHIIQVTASVSSRPVARDAASLRALTQGGLEGVTRELAIEYGRFGIRVNAVSPRPARGLAFGSESDEVRSEGFGAGREIQELVDATLYLERATFVTGKTLNLDHGREGWRY